MLWIMYDITRECGKAAVKSHYDHPLLWVLNVTLEEKVVTFSFMPIAFIVHFVLDVQNNISV